MLEDSVTIQQPSHHSPIIASGGVEVVGTHDMLPNLTDTLSISFLLNVYIHCLFSSTYQEKYCGNFD